jgi:HEPN domain-containing protein
MRPEIVSWFKQAREDLSTAEVNFVGKKYYAAVFFCQQAMEKGMKAIVLARSKNPMNEAMTSHSLIFIGKEAKIPAEFHTFLRQLSPHYVVSRYPEAGREIPSELYDENIAGDFLKKSKEVMTWIEKQFK